MKLVLVLRVLLGVMVITLLGVGNTTLASPQSPHLAIQPLYAQSEEPILLPGMVLGLTHNVNLSQYSYVHTAFSPYRLLHSEGGDLGASSGEGFNWWSVADPFTAGCTTPASVDALPEGIVLGLSHNPNLIHQSAFGCQPLWDSNQLPFGVRWVAGGDLGGNSAEGFFWYTTMSTSAPTDSNNTPAYWDYLDRNLPMYTVVGLCHSENRPDEVFFWRGKAYSACNPNNVPQGFQRIVGGDLGASDGVGYFWFEKITGPQILDKRVGNETIRGASALVISPNRRLACNNSDKAGWNVIQSLYLAGFCSQYVDRNSQTPQDNMVILAK